MLHKNQILIILKTNKMKKILYALPILLGSLFLASCDQDEAIEEIDNSAIALESSLDKLYAYQKDITINSEEGSQAVVRVFSNNLNDVTAYSDANIRLVEIQAKESLNESLLRNNLIDLSEEKSDSDDVSDPDIASDSGIAFQLLHVNKSKEGVRYALSFNHPETSIAKADWQYYTHYSSPNQETIAEISRNSLWRRVYYGLKYKAYSGSSWATIQNEWKLVPNNSSYSHTKNPCYQFRMRVKTKKSSAYSVTFDY